MFGAFVREFWSGLDSGRFGVYYSGLRDNANDRGVEQSGSSSGS